MGLRVAAAFGFCVLVSAGAAIEYATLTEAFTAAGFDPSAPGSWTFAAAGDPHYRVPDRAHLPAIEEINALDPPPAFFMIAGDLICSAALYLGRVPSAGEKRDARAEFHLCQEDLATLDVPYHLVLGNHDTPVYEEPHGALFHEVFSKTPLYSTFETNGVVFLLLNAHGAGYIRETDELQWQWLTNEVAHLAPTQTVICVQHYPRVGDNVEHGLSHVVRRIFDRHEGELWMLCGHDSQNRVRVYKLPRTRIVEAEMKDSYRNPGAGYGWWLFCMRNDHVYARIYHDYDGGYTVDEASNVKPALTIPTPFEGAEGDDIPWSLLLGVDEDNRTSSYAVRTEAKDCVTHWFYVNDLVYRLPLADHLDAADSFAVLAHLTADCTVLASADNATWVELARPVPRRNLYVFPIPEACSNAGSLYVRMHTGRMSDTSVGGFALLRHAAPTRSPDRPTPAAPHFTSAVPSCFGIRLRWQPRATGSIAGYRVYRRTPATAFELVGSPGAGATSFLDDFNLIRGAVYTYIVSAYDGIQESRGLCLDGRNDFAVLQGDLDLADEPFTITAWVRLAQGTALASKDDHYGIFFKGSWGHPLLQFSLRGGEYRGVFCRTIAGDLSHYHDLKPATDQSARFLDGQWHHVCARRDETGRGALYIDGLRSGTLTDFSGTVDNEHNAALGCCYPAAVPSAFFAGCIDELKLYNRALEEPEIQADHASGTTPIQGLVSWWKLNSIAGSLVIDEMGRHDGSLNNVVSDRCWGVGYTGTPLVVTNVVAEDSDQDSMRDDWEREFFETLDRDGTGDYDADGLTDGDEFLAGTSPTDQADVLAIRDVRVTSNRVLISWPTLTGRVYTVYSSGAPTGDWTAVSETTGTGYTVNYTNAGAGGEPYFFRLGVKP